MTDGHTETLRRWLARREPADEAARSMSLTGTVAAHLAHIHDPADTLRILDLGAGTGANIRFLAPRIPRAQQWLAVDRDPGLLDRVPHSIETGSGDRAVVETRVADLGELAHQSDLFEDRHLVTASALLDLVSLDWLGALAAACRQAKAAVLFAITYDGRFSCRPVEPEDESVRVWFNRHQHQDKGLGGPAAGPDAVSAAVHCLEAEGYHVRTASSDWVLDGTHPDLQGSLIDGWAEAAAEVASAEAEVIDTWRTRRRTHVDTGRSRLVVGHHDLAAWLA